MKSAAELSNLARVAIIARVQMNLMYPSLSEPLTADLLSEFIEKADKDYPRV